MTEAGQSDDPRYAPEVNKPRQPLSCAECRRLKLKCNRKWPCSSCQKRGLANLCPAGALTTRQRHKPPAPTPHHVRERIYELQARISALETALATLQATVSTQPHPLLVNNPQPYLHKKLMRKTAIENAHDHGLDVYPTVQTETPDGSSRGGSESLDEAEGLLDSLGTLSIAPDGRSTFFGPTAVSEGLSVQDCPASLKPISLPVDIAILAQTFPFVTPSAAVTALHKHIGSYLPPIHRAESLCASYFAYANFVANVVPQDEWFATLFSRLYGTQWSAGRSPPPECQGPGLGSQRHLVPAEDLSVFFAVLALGALTDLSAEPFSAEAETYYRLSRALLTGENVLTEPTISSVQTLFLASYYEGLQSKCNSSRDCWIMMVLASKTAQIMGLHREHSTFGLDERAIQRRRVVFWETYSMDMIQSLALGRPFSTHLTHMNTKLPVDQYATTGPTGEVEESFYQWKYRFCAEVMSIVSDHVLRVKVPSYWNALEADRRLRGFVTTFGRRMPEDASWSNPHTAAQFQMMVGTRETCMLYIHRGFFAHAVSTEPLEPQNSKYGRSVLAAYESACLIVHGMQNLVRSHLEFGSRLWFLWNHLLSASFVLGSIAARAPRCSLAAPASAQLDIIFEILKQASVYGGRAEYMLPIICRLQAKGENARTASNTDSPPGVRHVLRMDDDELAVIGGKTRVVLCGQSARHAAQQGAATDASSALLHMLQPPESLPPDLYFQPPNEYPVHASAIPQAGERHWGQDGSLGTSRHTEAPFGPQGEAGVHAEYPLLLPQQHVYPTYGRPLVHDVGANLWQTLVRDLGGL